MQVSVIMPVYNAAPFLDRAIQSALDQPQVVELIAIDDASTDGSERILSAWAEKSDRVIYLPALSKEPQRAAAARNRGLAVATAPFIAFLDADDYYLPGRFTRTEAYFKAHPEVEGLVEPVEVRYEEKYTGPSLKREKLGYKLRQSTLWGNLSYFDIVKPGLPINGWTLKRRTIHKVGYFKELQYQKEDLDFLRRLVYYSIPVSIAGWEQSSVAIYAHHEINTSSNQKEAHSESAKLELLWLKRLARKPESRSDRLRIFYRFVVFRYESASWNRLKKLLIYPFLFTYEGLKLIRFLI
jgi:glycosyltransferase involved in cell wall biosynthesis